MDINHLLLWFVGLSCGSILVQAIRLPTAYSRGWTVVAGFILGVTAGALYLLPQQAGLIGGCIWAILFVMPMVGIRWVHALTYQEQYQKASRLATILGWLHPTDGWRDYPHLLRAIALSQHGHPDRAIAILSRYQSSTTFVGRLATVSQYRLASRWADLLAWVRNDGLMRVIALDANLMLYYLRSLGETGDLNGLLYGIEQCRPTLERTGNTRVLNLVRLFALAFCGQPDRVKLLLNRSFGSYSQNLRQFWLATAEMTGGQREIARNRLLLLQPGSDFLLAGAIAHRLHQPLVNPQDVLTDSARQILIHLERDMQQDRRYGRPFTFVGTTSYATYGLIGLNLLMFLLETITGGNQNEETLYNLGALLSTAVWQGEWWRLLAANFLHFGLLHLSMNMLGLYFLGGFVESTLGMGRYLTVYFMSGVGAMFLISLAEIVLKSSTPQILVGASAAIMGLLGATGAIMLYGWQQEKSRIAAKNFRVLLFVIGIQVVFDLTTPGISFKGHILGLLLGFLTSHFLVRHWRFGNQVDVPQ